jgi:hypothetical protein
MHLVSLAYTLPASTGCPKEEASQVFYRKEAPIHRGYRRMDKVRKRAMHLFIHKVRDEKLPIRSILRMIDTS